MYKILKDGKTVLSKIPGIYGGYKVDKIFGTLSCKSGMRMKKENRVFFHTLEDAVKFYIGIETIDDQHDWTYIDCHNLTEKEDYKYRYIRHGFIFKGEIKPEPYEIAANKYNL